VLSIFGSLFSKRFPFCTRRLIEAKDQVFRAEKMVVGFCLLSFGLSLAGSGLAQSISEFPMPPGTGLPYKIVAGPDGNLWFAEASGIGTITTSGIVRQIPIASASGAQDLIFDPDGNLWFTEDTKIGRLPRNGLLVEFSLPVGSRAFGIAAGSDGNVWFTEPVNRRIGRITETGSFVEFPVSAGPLAITAGPDGNLWFTEAGNAVGRISPDGLVAEFAAEGDNPYSVGEGITTGPDGAIWFTGPGGRIRRITTAGATSEFVIPRFQAQELGGITSGPDGNLWFTESSAPVGGRGPLPEVPPSKIGRITPAGVITEFLLPNPFAYPRSITSGPDGNLWVAELYVNMIARVSPFLPSPCERCIKTLPFRPDSSLNGTWIASPDLAANFCSLGDWSEITVRLQQVGEVLTGTLETKDGRQFGVFGTVERLAVALPMYSGECAVLGFQFLSVSYDNLGRAVRFSSQTLGRCCGTIVENVEFARA
jgi:virginiamycin B lyase